MDNIIFEADLKEPYIVIVKGDIDFPVCCNRFWDILLYLPNYSKALSTTCKTPLGIFSKNEIPPAVLKAAIEIGSALPSCKIYKRENERTVVYCDLEVKND